MSRVFTLATVGVLVFATEVAAAEVATSTAGGPAAKDVRDEDIFGSPDSRDADVFGTKDSRDADVFGSGSDSASMTSSTSEMPVEPELGGDSSERIFSRLDETNDRLQIGGRMYLRLDLAASEGTPALEQALSSPSLFDLYLDARPSERLRGYVRGRLRYDFTAREDEAPNPLTGRARVPVSAALDQLYAKFDVGQVLFVTLGKQAVRFGTGRFWNPTDFLNQQRLDPLAVFDERLGVGLLKLHAPIESLGWNLYAIGSFEGATSLEQLGGAVRAEVLLEQTELSVSVAARKGQPIVLGFDVSSGVWLFDLKAELALLHDVRAKHWKGAFIVGASDAVFPEEVDRSDDWIPQLVLGAEVSLKYSDEDNLTLGAEYFYNDAGYSSSSLYPWLGVRQVGFGEPIQYLYLGLHYAAAYFLLMGPGSWNDTTVIGSSIANLSDMSALLRLDWRVLVLTYLQLNLYGSVHVGSGELRFGLELPPTTVIPGLENGFKIPTQLFEVGAGLTVNF
ncbi:MAG: hypothetical protein HYV07_03980 [Deltaproteobacteria bacterium]|nr:hypothetical protein [Deltaproteobacteria bacterium]